MAKRPELVKVNSMEAMQAVAPRVDAYIQEFVDQVRAHEDALMRGEPTPKVDIAVTPDRRGALYAHRAGYTVTPLGGPVEQVEDHRLFDIDSLVRFSFRHREGSAQILVGDKEIVFAADPCAVEEPIARMALDYHPRFAPWADVLGVEMTAPALRELLLDNEADTDHGTAGVSEGKYLATKLAKLKLSKSSETKIELADTGFIEASASSGTTALNEKIPTEFTIHVPIFRGVGKPSVEYEDTYPLVVKIGLNTNGPYPTFKLRIPLLPIWELKARQDIAKRIRELVEGGADDHEGTIPYVGLGNFAVRKYTGRILTPEDVMKNIMSNVSVSYWKPDSDSDVGRTGPGKGYTTASESRMSDVPTPDVPPPPDAAPIPDQT